MRFIKEIITIIVLLLATQIYAQCDKLKKLFEDDLYTYKELRDYTYTLDNPDIAFDAWKILKEEASELINNVDELDLVSKNLTAIDAAGGYIKWKAVADAVGEIRRFGKNIFKTTDVELSKIQKIHAAPKKGKPSNFIDDLADDIKTNGYDLDSGPPIEGYTMPDGKIIIIDGHHRLAALEKLGETNIPIRIHDFIADEGLRKLLKIGEYSGFYPPSAYPKGFQVPDFGTSLNGQIDGEALDFIQNNF